MRHHLVPELEAKAKLLLKRVAGIFQTAHVEIKLVAILRPIIERLHIIVIRGGHGTRLAKAGEERKILRQKQRAVVMIVVAVKPIRDGCLGRDGFDRRMTIDARH